MASNLFDIRGHVAIVTGAASGLGLAMAEVLAEYGAIVAMADNDEPSLHTAAARLGATGARVEPHHLDVTDTPSLGSFIEGVAARHGRLDIAFANAGSSSGPGFAFPGAPGIAEVKREVWDRILDLNLTSVFETVRMASVPMVRQKRGRIVVTASIAGLRSEVFVGYPYIATKAAVANLVRQAAHELAPHNVLVNAIAPGSFRTNIAGGKLNDPAIAAVWAKNNPLGRIAEPGEIKGLALYLASPASSYMTGAVIPIDGGSTA